MLVKIKCPVKGFGYFGGETADLPDDIAADFVNVGIAVMVPETEGGEENTLPEDLPFRKLLAENGFTEVKQILSASDTLTDIKGIGPAAAGNIVEFCKNYVD